MEEVELAKRLFDIAIIGGGINGCGIARDAAGRGASVFLCERGDLACGTSSASTKLIHGGLRYLEHYEFRLVREALQERELLLSSAPHIIWPLRFVLPYTQDLRPVWLLRLGLFIYDHLGGRKLLPATRMVDFASDPPGAPLKDRFSYGFEYSDCWVDDARLVVLNALDAAERGATIRVRSKCVAAERSHGQWRLIIKNRLNGETDEIFANTLVNAAGPWVSEFITTCARMTSPLQVRLVKGSHIVVPRHFEHDHCYIFQNEDQRVVFAIPYERDFTLIGTTDVDFIGDPGEAQISKEEIDYLCTVASTYFGKPVERRDIVHTFSGVRPLYDDGVEDAKSATRDYELKLDTQETLTPLLNVYGGKITTYRRLAEAALEMLSPFHQHLGSRWTDSACLPGGDFPVDGFDMLIGDLRSLCPELPEDYIRRLARAYGTRAKKIITGAKSLDNLGVHFGADLYEAEVAYLVTHEWAQTAEDILWRRSKLGLRFSTDEIQHLDMWLRENRTSSIELEKMSLRQMA